MTTETKPTLTLERETCGRCGGSGQYSYNQIDGSRCYGCNGTGERLTKRGKAASVWLRDRLAMKAEDVEIGQRIRFDWHEITTSAVVTITVAEIERGPLGKRKDPETGEWIQVYGYTFTSREGRQFCLGEGMNVRRVPSEADVAAAVEYQNGLTKAGKPRKRRAKAAN